MTLGDKLKALREVRGWSQHELSRHAGVRQALISELESGKKQETTTSVLRRLARTLHVSMDYLGGMYNGEPTHRCQVCLVGYLVVALAVPWVLVSHLIAYECDRAQPCTPVPAVHLAPHVVGTYATRERCEGVARALQPLWEQLVQETDEATPASPDTGIVWRTTFTCQASNEPEPPPEQGR